MIHKLVAVLMAVWALPLTLIGLVVAVIGGRLVGSFRARPWAPTTYFFEDKRGVLRWLWRGGYTAFTMGQVAMVSDENLLNIALYRHEHHHTVQAGMWGVLLIPAYYACAIWSRIRHGQWWGGNPFEVSAQGAEEKE